MHCNGRCISGWNLPFLGGTGATTWIFLILSVASIMFGWWIDQAQHRCFKNMSDPPGPDIWVRV